MTTMKHINATAAFLDFTYRIKPVLMKLLPVSLLRRIKKRMVLRFMSKLESKAPILPFARTAYPDGVNLIGFIKGEIGLGESCRLIAASLQEAGIDFTIYNYEQVSAIRSRDASWEHKITDTTPYNINLIHINPYELPLAYSRLDHAIWDNRYNIAFWLWELEVFPHSWLSAIHLVDEIWTPSDFAGDSIRKATDKPVRTIPYGLATLDKGTYGRAHFDLPEDPFLFLCMYDSGSTMERKNPLGAIEAYKRAFPPDEPGVGLIIKINNPQPHDIQAVHTALAGYPEVFILSDVLEKTEVHALIACADVYVSLHRSEGFGLVPAEAMMLGTPVIATDWSANTEFMHSDIACMVGYQFVTIEEDCGPYEAGNRWAEPDIGQAADFMRKLYEDDDYHTRMTADAQSYIREKLAPARAAHLIRDRIEEIYAAHHTDDGGMAG